MVEIEQCVPVVPAGGGPFQTKHKKSCTSDYCDGAYATDRANHAIRKAKAKQLEGGQ